MYIYIKSIFGIYKILNLDDKFNFQEIKRISTNKSQLTQECFENSILEKKNICEEYEHKIETIKRLMGESDLAQIREISMYGDETLTSLQGQYNIDNELLFSKNTREKDAKKELEQVEQEIEDLKLENLFIKEDVKKYEAKKKREDFSQMKDKRETLHKDNRIKDDNKEVEYDDSKYNFWESRIKEIDMELQDHLAVFSDMGDRSDFNINSLQFLAEYGMEQPQNRMLTDKEMLTFQAEHAQEVAQEVENWVNLFVIIHKKNQHRHPQNPKIVALKNKIMERRFSKNNRGKFLKKPFGVNNSVK